MADITDITNLLKTIAEAVYGKDMRSALHDSIGDVYNDLIELNGEYVKHAKTTATGSVEGHVKLSDKTDSTSDVSGGVAATPKAVNTVYADLNTHKAVDSSTNVKAKATDSDYGHVKLSDDTTNTSAVASGGTAATPKAVYTHANTKATGSVYGHVKLSDDPTSTSAASSGGIATTPAAVQKVNAALDAETKDRKSADESMSNRLTALEDDQLDTRVKALEKVSHTHENKDVLDGITEERVTMWDENTDISAYKEYVNEVMSGALNEINALYGLIGVVVYDGGLFTQEYDGDTLDGGAFTDTDLTAFDCGDFEPITAGVTAADVDGGEY